MRQIMEDSFIKTFKELQEASFKAEPTLKPYIEALWPTLFSPIILSCSSAIPPLSNMYFALYQLPPEFVPDIPNCIPLTMSPIKYPANILEPIANPRHRHITKIFITVVLPSRRDTLVSLKSINCQLQHTQGN